MTEAPTLPEVPNETVLSDNDDLPSINPQINKYNNAVRDPATGKFASTKAKVETPTTDLPPPPPEAPQPEPQAETPPAAPAPAVASKRDPMLIEMARRLSVPEHLIAATSDDQLRENIRLMHQIQPGQAPPAPVAKAADPDDEIDLGFDETEHPEFAGKLKAQFKSIKGENKQLQQRLEQMIQHQEQFRRQQEAAQFDAMCAKHPEVFGAGSYNELDPRSVEATRRGMLFQQVNQYYQGNPWVNLDEAFKYFSQVFGVAAKPAAAPAAPPPAAAPPAVDPSNRITQKQWEAAGLLPPSQRNGTEKPLSRYERMVREEVAKRMLNGQAAGLSVLDDNSDLPKHPG